MKITRHGDYIRAGNGITAKEGFEGSVRILTIRKDGKEIKTFYGSSLSFNQNLTDEDRKYIRHLIETSLES